jgi:hypothetical protein
LFVYQLLITWVDKINYKSMGQQEGTHLVSERIEGHISSQVIETMSMEKKVMPQEQLSGNKMVAFLIIS